MKTTHVLAWLGLGALMSLSAACKVTVNEGKGGGGGGDGGSGGGAQCFAPGPCCSDAPDDPCCDDSPSCSGTGTMCGGIAGIACAKGEFCDYDEDRCGEADGAGVCKKIPNACPEIYDPVCACDGTVYSNACEAQNAGVDVSNYGACTPPDDSLFNCGSGFCFVGTDYCERSTSDVSGYPDSFMCKSLPAACGKAPDCACLANEVCGDLCESVGGGFQLTCPGG